MGKSLRDIVGRIYHTVLPPWLSYLGRELRGCETVLDLGCGRNSTLQYVSVPYSLGIEIFEPYLEESRKRRIHTDYICADINDIEFRENSFDAVLAIELIEHLTKEDGLRLIKKMERWARVKVIIVTPNSFLPQDEYDDNFRQIHLSGWNVREFNGLGYNVYGKGGWKILKREKAELRFKPELFWRIVSDITQKLTRFVPRYAFQLFCVKQLDENRSCNG